MNQKVATLLNEQIQKELYSGYLYLGMANYYNEQGLEGFENWYTIQAQEERDHGLLMRTFLHNNGEPVTLLSIEAPPQEYADFAAPLAETLAHEKTVTASIHNIFAAASQDQDYRTMEFLNWFIKEQGEEEKNANDLIRKFELFGHDARALYQLDQELAARVYSPPSLVLD